MSLCPISCDTETVDHCRERESERKRDFSLKGAEAVSISTISFFETPLMTPFKCRLASKEIKTMQTNQTIGRKCNINLRERKKNWKEKHAHSILVMRTYIFGVDVMSNRNFSNSLKIMLGD